MASSKSLSYAANREELRIALQKSFLQNLTNLGSKAKDLDFFAGNKKQQRLKKAA